MRRLAYSLYLGLPLLLIGACSSEDAAPGHDSGVPQVLGHGVDVPSLNDRRYRDPLGGEPTPGATGGAAASGGASSGTGGSSQGGLGGMNLGGLGGMAGGSW